MHGPHPSSALLLTKQTIGRRGLRSLRFSGTKCLMDDLPPPQYEPWMNEVDLEDATKTSNPFNIFRQDDPYDFGDEVGSTEGIGDEGGDSREQDKALSQLENFKPFSPPGTRSHAPPPPPPPPQAHQMSKVSPTKLTERDFIRNDVRSATTRLLSLLSEEETNKQRLAGENGRLKGDIEKLNRKISELMQKDKRKDLYIKRMITEHKHRLHAITQETMKFKSQNEKVVVELKRRLEAAVDTKKYLDLEQEHTLLKEKHNRIEATLKQKRAAMQKMIKMHNESTKRLELEKQREIRKLKDSHKKELSATIQEIEHAAMDAVKNVHLAHVAATTSDDDDEYFTDDCSDSETRLMNSVFRKMNLNVARKLPFEIGSIEGLWPVPPEEQRGDGTSDATKNVFKSPNSKRRLAPKLT